LILTLAFILPFTNGAAGGDGTEAILIGIALSMATIAASLSWAWRRFAQGRIRSALIAAIPGTLVAALAWTIVFSFFLGGPKC